ncbi:MAG: 4-hydroxybutyrate dehydrogenase [Lachnospiraceae bacterium]|nr:4-hydroxybutyrate dehydrogenase [Candidatus Equihabitans merdae]
MRQLLLKTDIHKFDTFKEFVEEFKLTEDDLLFTNEWLYKPYMEHLNLPCQVYFQEQYGLTEPTDIMYNSIMADLKKLNYKRIIAVGGGTVVDMAKWMASEMPDDIYDAYKLNPTFFPKHIKELVIIPTTCGTGSEVTNIAMIYLTKENTKKGCANNELFADYAVLIPEFLKTLPYNPFMYSAIDALIHAVESYVGRRYTDASRLFGKRAIELLMNGFKKMVEEGPDARFEILEDFSIGSNYAGIAFGTGGCNAVHAMSFPLGGMFHVAHGESNYALFTTVMKFYARKNPTGAIKDINRVLADILGLDTDGPEVYDALEEALCSLIRRKPLREYGVNEEICAEMADLVIEQQQRLMTNTYVEMDYNDVYNLYLQCL